LITRGLDSPEMIEFRLANAKKDIEEAPRYHYVIVNEEIEEAVEKLKTIIIAEQCRRDKNFILEEKKRVWEENHGKNYSRGLSEKGRESI
jgi:guanylate kinase